MLMEAIWLTTALYGTEGTTAFLEDPNSNPNTPSKNEPSGAAPCTHHL